MSSEMSAEMEDEAGSVVQIIPAYKPRIRGTLDEEANMIVAPFWGGLKGNTITSLASASRLSNPPGFERAPRALNGQMSAMNLQQAIANRYNPWDNMSEALKGSLMNLSAEDEDLAFNGKYIVLSGQVNPLTKQIANRAISSLKVVGSLNANSSGILAADLMMKKMRLYSALNGIVRMLGSINKSIRQQNQPQDMQIKAANKLRAQWLSSFVPVDGDSRMEHKITLPSVVARKQKTINRYGLDPKLYERYKAPLNKLALNSEEKRMARVKRLGLANVGELKDREMMKTMLIKRATADGTDGWVSKNIHSLLVNTRGSNIAVPHERYFSGDVPLIKDNKPWVNALRMTTDTPYAETRPRSTLYDGFNLP